MNAAAKREIAYDVIVIGAGVIGCCAARELARYNLKVTVLEAGLDLANGATKANSGIVHAGYDPIPGTLKARYNVAGAKLFPEWQRELGFAYFKNGALVVAFSEDELVTLQKLHERGMENGASATQVISAEELRALEPNVSPEALGALLVPESGVCDPYGLTYAAAENAAANGVIFRFAERVQAVKPVGGYYEVVTEKASYKASVVVNAAGAYSDEINNQVSAHKLRISPRKGEYALFKNDLHPFGHTMFPAPSSAGKGVLVGMTAFGNTYIGPSADTQESKTEVGTSQGGLGFVRSRAKKIWPGAEQGVVISNFAGLRATNADTGDFVIGQPADAPGFFNAACIDSPGLASAPAIAADLAAQVGAYLGAQLNETFNPVRVPAPLLAMMSEEDRRALIAQNPLYGVAACGCCDVSEGEVMDVLHRALPVLCLDALKWRTGATMGPCQGGKCTGHLMQLMLQENGGEAADVMKRQQGSTWAALDAPALVNWPGLAAFEALIPADSFERPRSMYQIPGTRPAGVYSAFAVLDMAERLRVLPGKSALIWGDTELAEACAQVLRENGVAVQQVPASEAKPVLVMGDPRVSAVRFADDQGEELVYECDTFIISAEWVHK